MTCFDQSIRRQTAVAQVGSAPGECRIGTALVGVSPFDQEQLHIRCPLLYQL